MLKRIDNKKHKLIYKYEYGKFPDYRPLNDYL